MRTAFRAGLLCPLRALLIAGLPVFAAVAAQLADTSVALTPASWRQAVVTARDSQNVEGLTRLAAAEHSATGPGLPPEAYRRAYASSALAEVYLELGRKPEAASAAKQGVALARQALQQSPGNAEFHRLLGTLCGQVIPASPLSAFSYGRCALEEIDAALRLDPKLAAAYLSRGVGNYYLPPAFGGGLEKAEQDLRKALQLDPALSDAHLWMGLILRRQGNLPEALDHLETAARLAPHREWIRTQLAKTPQPTKP